MSNFVPSTNLDFNELWQPTTDLEFDKQGGVDDNVNISISATVIITALGSITADEKVTGIAINAVYDLNAVASGTASYDANVFRGVIADIDSDFQQSKLAGTDKQSKFESNKILTNELTADWQQSRLIGTDNQVTFESDKQLQTSSQFLFEQAKLIGTSSKQLYEAQLFLSHSQQIKHEQAKLVGHDRWFSFEAMAKRQIERQLKAESARLIGFSKLYSNRAASVLAKDYELPKEFAKLMYGAWSERFIIDPDVPIPPEQLTLLNFACKWFKPDTHLNFGADCQQDQKTDFNAGVIFVTNSVSLVRSDDGREIVLNSFNISSDNNSFGWSFNASLPFTELNKVNILNEEFVSVDLNVNGFLWRFILDACDDSVQFNSNNLNIKGQSRSMLLTSPYFDARSYKFQEALSSRQIAESELNRDSQLTGFSLDWNLIEANGWNVPADVYSYIDKTPINSLQHIANSVGGFVNTHPNQDVIKMLSHYPVASWDWETLQPEITLTESIITSMSRKRNRRPNYNGVVVSGEHSNSVSVFASRTGSDGGYRHSMITNNLITEQSAGIERAKVELSRSGDMAEIDLSSPLIKELGILYPSDFIRIIDSESWIGIVRGVSITGSIGSSRDIKIEQKLKIERNLNGA